MKDMEEIRKRIDALLKTHFKPEFLNRIDEIVVFDRLDAAMIRKITDLRLGELAKRLADRSLTLVVEDAAKDLLAQEGFDPQFGARPLKRVIQNRLENPIAKKLLAGEVHEGDTIVVHAVDGDLEIEVQRA
jgi:ATP-dependent Clp protease ATP-binding subunit ClpB